MIQGGLGLRLENGKVFLQNHLSEKSIFAQEFSMRFYELNLSPVKTEPAYDYRQKAVEIAPGEQVAN